MSDLIGGLLIGFVLGATVFSLLMVFTNATPSRLANRHCKSRALEFSQIAPTGEIECVKVTRVVVTVGNED